MKLLIHSIDYSSRLQYACKQVFVDWLGLSIEWTNDKQQYINHLGAKINYGTSPLYENDFLIPKCTLLSENDLKELPLFPTYYHKIPALFPLKTTSRVFTFDLLASIFFMLSRYEEYLPYQADQHGRFPALESWAYQNNCLQQPVVDLLVGLLKNKLKERFPELVFKKHQFQFLPTYDIDMAWAFSLKGWKREIGGYLNDISKGQFKSLKNRIKTHLRIQKDPFQTFDLIAHYRQKYQLQAIFFFLLADLGPYDKNNLVQVKAFQKLIQQIASDNQIGIHPSYQSNDNQAIIKKEISRLDIITQQKVYRSRQHYLKLHLPETYQQLVELGISTDYSMGYAMEVGFRAGTSFPFKWYDLKKEVATNLIIQPFQVMDVTLKDYLKLSPEAAKNTIDHLIEITKSVEGSFCSLWHNSSFHPMEGWDGWQEVYEHLLEKVAFSCT